MITISDVAAKAGVSRATVSYVLNGRDTSVRISDLTRQKVLHTASEMGYRRNELARAMTTGKNRMLGFWVMQSNREPVVRVLSGAMKEADEHGYFIKMLGFDNGALDVRTLERCVEWRLSGIIAIHAPAATIGELFPQIVQTGIPFVTVDSQPGPAGCLNISANNEDGMRATVAHLADLGHHRIAFLGGCRPEEDSISGARQRAYGAEMERRGLTKHCQIECGDWTVEWSDWQEGETACAVRRLLNSPIRPTAIACASDHLAMMVVRIASERGLRVPDDLSVTGFDDVAVATLYNPPLTTVSQPFELLGRAAVRSLLTPDGPEPLLPAHLIVRGSTAPPYAS